MKPVEARWPRFALAAFAVLQEVRRLRALGLFSRSGATDHARASTIYPALVRFCSPRPRGWIARSFGLCDYACLIVPSQVHGNLPRALRAQRWPQHVRRIRYMISHNIP